MGHGYRERRRMRVIGPALGVWLFASSALGAYPTQTLTALEKQKSLPDLHLGVTFDRNQKSARITREWIQGEGVDRRALDVRELDYSEYTNRLLIDLRVGLFRDLEFHAQAPLVLQNKSKIGFSEGVDGLSTVWGSDNANDPSSEYRFPLTEVPGERSRAGFGDMTFGLSWSPLVDSKDEAYPTITLRADIVAPTGSVRDPTDQAALPGGSGGGVGLGQTVFDLSVSANRRMLVGSPTLDPYMTFGARLPVATAKQKERGMEPPIVARFIVGSELLIHENAKNRVKYALDVSFNFRYVSVGRTYSELSDYLPNFDQTRVSDEVPVYSNYANPNNYAQQVDGTRCGMITGVPCGELNRVDEHVQMGGAISLHLQPSEYFFLRSGFTLGFASDHLLTAERVGRDADPPEADGQLCGLSPCVGRVNARNSAGADERSPYYDPRYDTPGRRLRAEQIVDLGFFVSAVATF